MTSSDNPIPPKPFNPAPAFIAVWFAVLWASCLGLDISFTDLLTGMDDMGEYLSRYGTPDFSDLSRYLELLAQTVAIAVCGTFLAITFSILLAPTAARNLTIGPLAYRAAREILNFMRAMPDLLLALVFVAALGLGPLPGVIALGIHTAGFLGKFFAECLERVDPGVIEAMEASGAGRTQTLMYAGWPSILREAAGYSLYIMDRNIRMATVLGLVGAGGIGLALHDTLRLFEYNEAAALIIVIFVTLLAFDYISSWIRKKIS